MNQQPTTAGIGICTGRCPLLAIALRTFLAACCLISSPALAEEVEGFTEPYRLINVAAIETGIIEEILVREGQTVKKKQALAKLDNEVHQVLLEIAKESKQAKGRLNSTLAELRLRQQRLEKFIELQKQGHARQEEVERARADLDIAQAQVLSAREEALLKELEYKKIKIQLERRTIRAPFDGVVTVIHKDRGEIVSGNDPYVMQMVQLNPLLATFSAETHLAKRLRVDQTVVVKIEGLHGLVMGKVEFISPVTDAESGTVRIKVKIDNADKAYRSGERCFLKIPSASQP